MDHQRPNPLLASPPEDSTPDEKLRNAQKTLQWLEPLCKNPDFKEFMAVVASMARDQQQGALNVSLSTEARNNHAQRHHALRAVLTRPEEDLNSAMQVVRNYQKRDAPRQAL